MTCARVVNSCGLFLDILGVALIWKYGLPESLSREGHDIVITETINEAEKAKAAKYDLRSKFGLGLVVAGFVLQLASNFIPR